MTRATLKLTLLLCGGVVSMPVVVVGHILAEKYGTLCAISAIAIGNALLCAVGFLTAHLALTYRASTSDTVLRIGGAPLGKVFSVAMIVSMLGWFAVQCSLLVEFAAHYWSAPQWLIALAVGATLIVAAMGNITRLLQLSEKLGPLVLVFAIVMFGCSVGEARIILGDPSFWPALSLVVATSLGVVIDVPTYYRLAASRMEAFVSIFVLVLAMTFVEILGVVLAGQTAFSDIIMSPFGIVMAASGWLMNVNNLYSAVVSSQTLFARGSFAMRSILFGAATVAIVCAQASNAIVTSIEAFTLGISSMGGVMVACVLVTPRVSAALALTWALGGCVGGLCLFEVITLSGAAQIDAFLVSVVSSTLLLLGATKWQSHLSTRLN